MQKELAFLGSRKGPVTTHKGEVTSLEFCLFLSPRLQIAAHISRFFLDFYMKC